MVGAAQSPPYFPDRGDVMWLHFDPQAGREQWGRRPALVLSPRFYNVSAGLAVVCPVTSRKKGYAFEVDIPAGLAVTGVVLADQVRSMDWQARGAAFMCMVPGPFVIQVKAVIDQLI